MGIVKIYFNSGETTLSPDDNTKLTALVATLQPSEPVLVSGNSDNQGSAAGNFDAARERANSVRAFLIARGVPANSIKLRVNGDKKPALPNTTPENRAKNRRVDVVTNDKVLPAPTAARSLGDRAEGEGNAPVLEAAQGEVPLIANDVAVGAGHPWVGRAGILAPPRIGNNATFFVDGRDYMADLLQKIRAAKDFIFITDWSINPFTHLSRTNKPLQDVDTLLSLLQTAVQRKVVVRVMLWDSKTLSAGTNTHDAEAERFFEQVGVRVHRHQFAQLNKFTHHQKTVVMDNAGSGLVAYIGGLDITQGRWDTPQHSVIADPDLWVDKIDTQIDSVAYYSGDFYNSDISGDVLRPNNVPARGRFPRLPWHDIHARIIGPSAFDIQVNFVQRWNFQPTEAALPLPAASTIPPAAGNQVVQIIRSGSRASIGPSAPNPAEASILQAYINLIRSAQHHIYIENQYFVSNFGAGSPARNQLMVELANRIVSAIKAKQKFRVKIVLPVHPEGDMNDWVTQETLHWVLRTLVRPQDVSTTQNNVAPLSLVGRVLDALGGNTAANRTRLPEFLGLYALRNHGTLAGTTTDVTEQVYVHSKMMLIDDRVAIIGSANINDRSLQGDRDSELSAIIVDNDTKVIPIDGKNRNVRKFAHDLRLQLWQEHLGLSSPGSILDPVADATHKLWHDTATNNTRIYEAVFPNIPSNNHVDMPAQGKASAFDASKRAQLSGIKGHLVLLPLDWLRDEDLETGGLSDELFADLNSPSDGDDTA